MSWSPSSRSVPSLRRVAVISTSAVPSDQYPITLDSARRTSLTTGTGVLVGVGEGVWVGVAVGMGVRVCVGDGVGVGEGVCVGVAVGVGEGVGDGVGVLVGDAVGVLVTVGVCVGDGVDVFVGAGVRGGDAVGTAVGVLVGVAVCVAAGTRVCVGVAVRVGSGVAVCVGAGVAVSGGSGVGVLSVRDIGAGVGVGGGVSSPHEASKMPKTPANRNVPSVFGLVRERFTRYLPTVVLTTVLRVAGTRRRNRSYPSMTCQTKSMLRETPQFDTPVAGVLL